MSRKIQVYQHNLSSIWEILLSIRILCQYIISSSTLEKTLFCSRLRDISRYIFRRANAFHSSMLWFYSMMKELSSDLIRQYFQMLLRDFWSQAWTEMISYHLGRLSEYSPKKTWFNFIIDSSRWSSSLDFSICIWKFMCCRSIWCCARRSIRINHDILWSYRRWQVITFCHQNLISISLNLHYQRRSVREWSCKYFSRGNIKSSIYFTSFWSFSWKNSHINRCIFVFT